MCKSTGLTSSSVDGNTDITNVSQGSEHVVQFLVGDIISQISDKESRRWLACLALSPAILLCGKVDSQSTASENLTVSILNSPTCIGYFCEMDEGETGGYNKYVECTIWIGDLPFAVTSNISDHVNVGNRAISGEEFLDFFRLGIEKEVSHVNGGCWSEIPAKWFALRFSRGNSSSNSFAGSLGGERFSRLGKSLWFSGRFDRLDSSFDERIGSSLLDVLMR